MVRASRAERYGGSAVSEIVSEYRRWIEGGEGRDRVFDDRVLVRSQHTIIEVEDIALVIMECQQVNANAGQCGLAAI
jgi:hypothetical protein